MNDFAWQALSNSNRKTVSDMKIKKSLQLSVQDLARINNSFKFRQTKLNPIIGQITVIPIRLQPGAVRDILIGKQATKLSIHTKKLKSIEMKYQGAFKIETKQKQVKIKVENPEDISQNNQNNDKIIQSKLEMQLATFQKRVKSSRKLYCKMKTLPKIQNQLMKISQSKTNRPLLSSFDSNLKSIKSLHYFIMQHESQSTILSYRSKTKIEVASLTKIMTFYTIFKICEQYQHKVKEVNIQIQQQMVELPGTTASLEQHRIYTLQQLLYGMMLPSGNDASIALAIWGGKILSNSQSPQNNIKTFVERMNFQSKQLGLLDTSYGNPHGLPHKDNKTTCEDMARLCSICLNISLFREVIGTKIYKFKYYHTISKKKIQSHWENTNKLLRRPGFIGIKTGITVTAGPCLASAYEFHGKTYIVIIAKCNKPSRRFKQTRKLLAHCLERINYEVPLSKQQQLTLKRLGRTNQDIDSDYSDEENQFDFATFNSQQIQKRTRILTQL